MPDPDTVRSVLVVGEALIDIILAESGERAEHPGGSPANVAFGLGRLGTSVTLLTDLADDPHGRLLRRHLSDAGVVVVSAAHSGAVTSTATAVLAEDGSAQYDFELTWDVDIALAPPAPTILHTGSLGAVLGDERVVELLRARRGSSVISYDPNIRPDAMGAHADVLARVETLVSCSDLIKVSDEDLGWLYPGVAVEETARSWRAQGPRAVIVTRGAHGVRAFTTSGELELPAVETDVVDTVGAGDSFMAALVHHLMSGPATTPTANLLELDTDAWRAALRFAAAAAAITVSRAGADLPTLAEIESSGADAS